MNKRPLYISLVVYLIAGGIIGGIILGKAIQEPKVITERLIIKTETIHYEQSPPEIVYRYFNVPIKVENPFDLQEFPTVDVFKEWIQGRWVDIKGDRYLLPVELSSFKMDCDDIALAWQVWAEEDGYYLYPCPVYNGKVLGVKVSETKGKHCAVWTFIGNGVYVADTYSPFEVTYVCPRD